MFLVERYVNEIWIVSARHEEEWMAKELSSNAAKPATPSRIVSLTSQKVICYNGGEKLVSPKTINNIEVLGCSGVPVQGWNVYGRSNVKKVRIGTPPMDNSKGRVSGMENNSNKDVKPNQPEVAPVVLDAIVNPQPPSAPVPPVSVESLTQELGGTVPNVVETTSTTSSVEEEADEDDTPPEVFVPTKWSGTPTIALLFSGGLFSTAALVALVKAGYKVSPYFVDDANDPNSDRNYKAARGIVRMAASYFKGYVNSINTIDTRIAKSAQNKRRRKYIQLLEKELVGVGVNSIGYGKQSVFEKNADEELNLDRDVSSLQELTALEVISPETLEIEDLPKLMSVVDVNSESEKAIIYNTTSCEEPENNRECGDCDTCLMRYKLLATLFGQDNSRYVKGSTVRKLRKKGLLEIPEDDEDEDSE